MGSRIVIKLTIWIALLSLLSAGISVYFTYTHSRALLIQSSKDKLATATQVLANRYSFFIADITKDLLFIAQLPAIEEIASSHSPQTDKQRMRLANALSGFLRSHEEYNQVRFIGAHNHGLELVRVDKTQNAVHIVEGMALQEKAHYSYVYNTLKLKQGSVFVSGIRLNKERGLLDGYGKPSVIVATPVYGTNGNVFGVIVINVDLEKMFALIETDIPAGIDVIATNSAGDYILHPDAEKTFGFDKGARVLMQNDIPVTQHIFSGEVSSLVAEVHDFRFPEKQAVISLTKVPFATESDEKYIVLGLISNLDAVLEDSRQLGITSLQISLAFGVLFVLLSLILARKITTPLQRMATTFARFKQGDPVPELSTNRDDELGLLARNFSIMAKKLNAQLMELNTQRQYLHKVAHHDGLTGLPNRILLEDRIEQALISARRDKAEIAVMLIDLDDFKPVNDKYGHDIGDKLLQECAARMLTCIRETDTVARYGGDEFMTIVSARELQLRGMSARHISRQVADKIRTALNQPFKIDNFLLNISCSIGIAIYPQDGDDKNTLIKHADLAMYYAKSTGRNNVKLYTDTQTD
ncbi:GGDEF domain-containing protein [Cellvibrio fibrivorans]|uniref:Diguanylate cyclase (GGDEF)-like protein n=1 Tax=Cellvibrio fibrivorans TaxID=126350 RepID=A0ABU1UW21_9GAMM|nr:GGDEF domain-containing protein [Cellvibrio fibrivorans]MDR7089308.1 diguanylate cyclase (GGDEF)-like protein [Cellvibrio fibrivorans]